MDKDALIKAGLEGKTNVDALEIELRKVNKALDMVKLKVVQAWEMEKVFTKVNEKVKELEAEVDRQKAEIDGLKIEVSVAKETSIIEFKESDTYKDDLTYITALFLAKEMIKTKRVL